MLLTKIKRIHYRRLTTMTKEELLALNLTEEQATAIICLLYTSDAADD